MSGTAKTGALKQLAPLTDDQRAGADPAGSAWLLASAGAGKTQVLTARVLRLLLQGVLPERILCITYTRAGANEMATRIRERLAAWVRMSDFDLKVDLLNIGAAHLDPATQQRARQLFASVIDAPGQGLAIQTIHSFCQSLLGSFPLEAGLLPGFRLMADDEAALLRQRLLREMIADAPARGADWLLRALERLSAAMSDRSVTAYLKEAAAHAEAFAAMAPVTNDGLRRAFDLPLGSAEEMLLTACDDAHIPAADWRLVREELAGRKGTAQRNNTATIDEWLKADACTRAATLDAVRGYVATKEGAPLSHLTNEKIEPPVVDAVIRLTDWVVQLQRCHLQMQRSDILADLLRVGAEFAGAFRDAKRRAGLINYDDLIRHTRLLLTNEAAQWVRYKLDSQIEHVLVDEAQDTNDAQWAIITALVDEYYAGEGSEPERARTLFVVGDFKQAIFGFQGTRPDSFEAARTALAALAASADAPISQLNIARNYRSAPVVLSVVDTVLAQLTGEKLGLPQPPEPHAAHGAKLPGSVSLWPLVSAAGDDDGGGDSDDDDDGEGASAAAGIANPALQRLSRNIALSIAALVGSNVDGRMVAAGDIMVLLRERGALAALIVNQLQDVGVPVAGVDRMRLNTPLAVRDLVATMRFALQPLDDLNLAQLLVSPLIGWSQDALWQRGVRPAGTPLWRHLRAQPELAEQLQPLRELLARADFVTPSMFLEEVLSGAMRGRARMLARMGAAARAPIEELMTAAHLFEEQQGGSLHQFVRWFDALDTDISRAAGARADEVRVMTVHGSKGLEARFVILADAARPPKRARGGQVVAVALEPLCPVPLPLPAGDKDSRPDPVAAAVDALAQREAEEERRLLYVAMTRAERHLLLAGTAKPNKDGEVTAPQDGWYATVAAALAQLGAAPSAAEDHWTGERLTLASRGSEPAADRMQAIPATATRLPWVDAAPAAEQRPPRPLSPSQLEDKDVLSVPMVPPAPADATVAGDATPAINAPARAGMSWGQHRGTLVHSLFERLPGVAPGTCRDAALGWLAKNAATFSASQREAMVDSVLRVIEDPAHAAMFGADALQEVPFSALVDGRVIAGTIDRLLITDDAVTIVDFKTGAVPPAMDAIAPAYLRQMSAYAAAIAFIMPGREVIAALLFTDGPQMFVLSPAVLEQHKPRLAADE